MKVLFHVNFPKSLAEALRVLHDMQDPQEIEIGRTIHFDVTNPANTAVFVVDKGIRGLDISTEKQFQAGFKVFALKLAPNTPCTPFKLALVTLQHWPKILQLISQTSTPFIYTYSLNGKLPKQVK